MLYQLSYSRVAASDLPRYRGRVKEFGPRLVLPGALPGTGRCAAAGSALESPA